VGHLWVVEQRRKKHSTSPMADIGGLLLLTEEEWMARMKLKEKGGLSRSSGSGGGGGRDKNKGHNGGANSSS
jgi:hypothetical protein